MAIRRLGAHLFRRSAWWGYALAGLCLAVYVLIRLWFPEGDARDAFRQFFLILASVAVGAAVLPELPSSLWTVDARKVRNLIPGAQRDKLSRALIDAETSDPRFSRLVWEKALDPLLVASREPWRYVTDMRYSADVHLGRVIAVGDERITVSGLSVEHVSTRVLGRPGVHGLWVSVTRTSEALESEYHALECLARELAPIGDLEGAEWQEAIVRNCTLDLVVDGHRIPLEPVPAGDPDIVRWVAPADFVRGEDPVRVRVSVDVPMGADESTFPVYFSGYYCAGITEIALRVYDEEQPSRVLADHFIGRALSEAPLPPEYRVRTPAFEKVVFSTGTDTILWPGSGVLFRWEPR